MFERVVRHGTLVTVILLIVLILGMVAATRIPVQMIPDLDVRVISVSTYWPGATPQDVEKEILIEQEKYLRNLPYLTRVTATANTGSANVRLEFPLGTDITEMMIRVNNALSQVPSYPENVDEPQIYANSFSSNSFMFFSVQPQPGNPRSVDMDLMQDFLEDEVRPRMSSVPGVSEVSIWGGSRRQVQIIVDPARLAQRGLSLVDLRNSIRSRNRDRSGGDVNAGKRQYLLRTVGRFETLDDLNSVILARRGDQLIRLSDVATVKLDHFEKRSSATLSGTSHIMMAVKREAGSNVIEIKRHMLDVIVEINRDVLGPAGLHLELMSDDVRYVADSIRNVWQNLALGALLATLVLYLFLRSARATLIGALGIPVCVIVAFLGMLLAGRTINVISLAGIAFALGMTLDNSIVVLENIELERKKGASRLESAVRGVEQVWPAVFASTMTTVLVFLPIAFIEQEAGQLYSDVAVAISSAILASMLVAVTVIPTAAARLDFGQSAPTINGAARLRESIINAVRWLLATGRRRVSTVLLAAGVSGGLMLWLTPPAEYLPEGEEPKVFSVMSAPPGYNLPAMQEIGEQVQAVLQPHIGADPALFHRGESDMPAIAYSNQSVSAGRLRIIAEPVDPADIEALMDGLTRLYRQFPGMRAFASRGSIISSNDGGTRSINLDIAGPNLETIYRVASSADRRATEVFDNPRIQSQPSSLSLAQPLLQIRPNWERAAELGMTAQDLGFTVAAMTDGTYIDEFFLDDDKIDIFLYSDSGREVVLDNLAQVPLYTEGGELVPLGSVVDIKETVDTSSIRRVGGRRTVTLNIIPPREVPLESGVSMVREDVVEYLRSNGEIPNNVSVAISGAADQLDATRDALWGNYGVALLIVYLLLVAIFTHWGYPLLILTSVPVGIAGGIVGLAFLNGVGGLLPLVGIAAVVQSFDMISMLGFLILMGTVVNNPILLVHRAIENAQHGMDPLNSVMEALETRLRPIAMTTITTIFGLAPLVLIPGAGTELYRGVGVIVMFGILGAMLVSLTMLPALTVMVLQWKPVSVIPDQASA